MSNNTILKALDRMGYKGKMTGHGFRGLRLRFSMNRMMQGWADYLELAPRRARHELGASGQKRFSSVSVTEEGTVTSRYIYDGSVLIQ